MCLLNALVSFGIYFAFETGCPEGANLSFTYDEKHQDTQLVLKVEDGPDKLEVLDFGSIFGQPIRSSKAMSYSLNQVIKKMRGKDLEIISLDGKYETRITYVRISNLLTFIKFKY